MKNYLFQSLFLSLGVSLVMIAVYLIPSFDVYGIETKNVDVLSDIRDGFHHIEWEELDIQDSLEINRLPYVPEFKYNCPDGMTCIEDYSDSTLRGMTPFYLALDSMQVGKKDNVRIAVLGDSFIEGDIIIGDLREMLQNRYGGGGVGFMPITSQVSRYRNTIIHNFDNWLSYSPTAKDKNHRPNKNLKLISEKYYIPQKFASVEYRGQRGFGRNLNKFNVVNVIYSNKKPFSFDISINDGDSEIVEANDNIGLKVQNFKGEINSIKIEVDRASDSTVFYGVTLDAYKGISVDNMSLRGSAGVSLINVPSKNILLLNKIRNYDLVILQYGLNIASKNRKSYTSYKIRMNAVIKHLKKNMPKSGFLVMGVGDRDYKSKKGEVKTMPGIKNLVRYQREIAYESKVAFWSLFDAMGGDESMVNFVEAKPPMANRDYTHINFIGGKHIAKLLFDVLENGKNEYDRRKAYDE